MEDFKLLLDKKLDEFKDDMDKKLDEFKDDMDKKLDEFKKDMDNKFEEVNKEIKTLNNVFKTTKDLMDDGIHLQKESLKDFRPKWVSISLCNESVLKFISFYNGFIIKSSEITISPSNHDLEEFNWSQSEIQMESFPFIQNYLIKIFNLTINEKVLNVSRNTRLLSSNKVGKINIELHGGTDYMILIGGDKSTPKSINIEHNEYINGLLQKIKYNFNLDEVAVLFEIKSKNVDYYLGVCELIAFTEVNAMQTQPVLHVTTDLNKFWIVAYWSSNNILEYCSLERDDAINFIKCFIQKSIENDINKSGLLSYTISNKTIVSKRFN